MTAFDTAWALVKEYDPGWRWRADALPTIPQEDLMAHFNARRINHNVPSGSSIEYVLSHPHDDNFVVKVPRGMDDWGMGVMDPEDRHGSQYYGKNLVEELEDSGFPVVSEHLEGNKYGEYLVQPRLVAGQPDFGTKYQGRPTKGVADMTLNHIVSDRTSGNWGIDQTGNWRMFDVDLGLSEPTDWWPSSPETPKAWLVDPKQKPKEVGEILQEDLDKWGIQLPASRLLNFMSNLDHDRPGMQNFLETLEPYSDNPNYVTIDGKPEWREGY